MTDRNQDLTGTQVGDVLAMKKDRGWGQCPSTSHTILDVTKRTETQITCVTRGTYAIVKVRAKDGKVIGMDYRWAMIATPELLELNAAEQQRIDRYRGAYDDLNDLIDMPLHRLKLTIEQMEKLAAAWKDVKAMAAIPEG